MSEPRTPIFSDPVAETDEERAEQYVANDKLRGAVRVAVELGIPLLLTGEPGTGKTQLAHYVALELHRERPDRFPSTKAEVFHTKSTSVHTDLFYRYEALQHFRESRLDGQAAKPASAYIEWEPLGRAIIAARDKGRRTVVLVDEVDKAPRDFPNDILNEIEHMEFTVKETGEKLTAGRANMPVLIFTSNQERDLPDAFRRRCAFHHIEFKELDLKAIVRSRLGLKRSAHEEIVNAALEHFQAIRKMKLEKPPATAELINWMRYLVKAGIDAGKPESRTPLAASYAVLAKSHTDLELIQKPK